MKKIALLLFVFCGFVAGNISSVRADLLITPLRAVFEGRDRSIVVTLINQTAEYKTYRLDWKFLQATEDGQYENVTAEDYKEATGQSVTAAEMIRFSPRQVSLEPNGRQRIRLSLRRPAELPDGEYRSHLSITRLVDGDASAAPANANGGAATYLQVNLGFSIPVIIRQGKVMPTVSITNPRFEIAETPKGPQPKLKLDLINSGNKYSSYGSIKVFWIQPDGSRMEIGELNNVAVYPEVKSRTVGINLNEKYVASGRVQVIYSGVDEYDGVVFDDQTFTLQ